MEGHMKKNNLKIWTMLLAALLLFSGCIKVPEEEGTSPPANGSQIDKNFIGSYKTMQYTYLTDVNTALLTTNLNPDYLVLVNKTVELDGSYIPTQLTTLTCATAQSGRLYQLESRAAEALYAMLAEMQAAGVSDIMVTSAYRSYEYQVKTYNDWVKYESEHISEDAYKVFGQEYIKANYLEKGIYRLSLEDARTVAQSYSAQPGQSEHQTGLCIDFTTVEMDGKLTEAFSSTAAFQWLSQNAYKFGFILRYPQGMESITGYTYEPWHYRFVGREAATDIFVGKLTLEQYLQLAAQS